MFFFLIPYNVDVPMERWPFANWALMAFTVMVSVIAFPAMMGIGAYEHWMMSGPGDWWSDAGLLGSVFTHGGWGHLIGNLIFLFVFGNAVNAKLGHGLFIACYVLLGTLSGLAYTAASHAGVPSLGASGAIAGIMGMFIVFYPRNNISILFFVWILRAHVKVFQLSAWIVIGAYFAKDLFFQVLYDTGVYDNGVALMAHLAGTVAGVILASLLLLTDRIRPTEHEQTLLELVGMQSW
ncbi:MAG: rhomboid family intramembrane serine protease [Phycisphaeraceae bacterium]|nr:MAG: rhomboid family intramembrane serine protease [Phycisphaeraceae bacterium]